nr:MAG TPA: hypothetical protein [Crassvirales sp.]
MVYQFHLHQEVFLYLVYDMHFLYLHISYGFQLIF